MVGEQDGMEPACELPQLTQGVVELRGRLCQQLVRLLGCGPELRAGDAQRQRECHQALLCAVVEVSLELPPLLVACAYQPSARAPQVFARLRACDRQRHELAERAQARFTVRRQYRRARDGDRAPQEPRDGDRRRHGRAVADALHHLRRLAGQ